jgi:hypothetical protein
MKTPKETAPPAEARRSASQIMFGHLPEQTVDIDGGIWRVQRWRHPHVENAIDLEALQEELLTAAREWSALNRDAGLGEKLRSGKRRIQVLSLDRNNGIEVGPFPKVWICPDCGRVHRNVVGKCSCGNQSRRDQLQFVSYCAACGELDEPPIIRCDAHNEVTLKFPGSMSAADIKQECPVCSKVLRSGFAGKKCRRCGRGMMAQVHRAASVYSPRTVAIVNAATKDQLDRFDRAGGSAHALEWVLSGMTTRSVENSLAGPDTLRAELTEKKISPDLIEELIRRAQERGEITSSAKWPVPPTVKPDAEKEARSIALALLDSRQTVDDLVTRGPKGLRPIYETEYGEWMSRAGLEAIEYSDRFPLLTGTFGYTRGSSNEPQESALVPYMNTQGDFVVYGEIAETEALFIRLDPIRVLGWLREFGLNSPMTKSRTEARQKILAEMGQDASSHLRKEITTLVHSYCHRFIRTAAVHTGVERTSLSEYLVPHHLGFFVYAAARGDFVLGGLQAVFEGEMHFLLRDFVTGEHRCALDPGCTQNGAACMACLHLGEPSCRLFNRSLDRRTLYGPMGYLTQLPVVDAGRPAQATERV